MCSLLTVTAGQPTPPLPERSPPRSYSQGHRYIAHRSLVRPGAGSHLASLAESSANSVGCFLLPICGRQKSRQQKQSYCMSPCRDILVRTYAQKAMHVLLYEDGHGCRPAGWSGGTCVLGQKVENAKDIARANNTHAQSIHLFWRGRACFYCARAAQPTTWERRGGGMENGE
jgi:hypothetical protein